jgi:hypothetical protein
MSKILKFSSTHEDFFIDKTINKIKKDLEKPSISKKKLYNIQQELNQLNGVLVDNLRHQVRMTQSALTIFLQKQTELSALSYNCQNLFIDKCVDTLTEQAQKVAKNNLNSCKNISKRVSKLRKEISTLGYEQSLSLENRQMIDLANRYLNSKESIDLSKDTTTLRLNLREENSKKDLNELFDLSIALYEIAGCFYHCNITEAFDLFYSLSPMTQQEIKIKLEEFGVDLHMINQTLNITAIREQLYLIMQTCLGYSHYVLYQSFDYPSFEAIDDLFQDLDRTLKESVI